MVLVNVGSEGTADLLGGETIVLRLILVHDTGLLLLLQESTLLGVFAKVLVQLRLVRTREGDIRLMRHNKQYDEGKYLDKCIYKCEGTTMQRIPSRTLAYTTA